MLLLSGLKLAAVLCNLSLSLKKMEFFFDFLRRPYKLDKELKAHSPFSAPLVPIGRRGSSSRIESGSKFQLVKDYEHTAHLALYKSSIFVFA